MVYQFVRGSMYRIVSSCCLLVYSFMFSVFGSFFRQIFRCQERKISEEHETDSRSSPVFHEQNDHQIASACSRDEQITDKEDDSVFKDSLVEEIASSSSVSTRKYEFLSGEGINGYLEEPKTLSLTVHEVFEDSFSDETMNDTPILDPGGYADGDFQEDKMEAEDFVEEETEETEYEEARDAGFTTNEKKFGKTEEETEEAEDMALSLLGEDDHDDEQEHEKFSKGRRDGLKDSFESNHGSSNQVQFAPRSPILPFDTEEEESEFHASNECSTEKAAYNQEPQTVVTKELVLESDEEYIELEPEKQSSILMKPDQQELEDLYHEEPERKTCFPENWEEPKSPDKKCFSNSHDVDPTFDHDDIIEQLKMELKLARTGGLPTILEESEPETLETPKIVPELKPLKIDEKFGHKDLVDEIQKVYRSYLDKMRKLDILNFQTMHAVGLFQLKDTVGLQYLSRKSSRSGKKILLPPSLWFCKQGIAVVEPTTKIVSDMREDFEVVYVGQLCLSWEILHWQYGKVHELQSYDHQEFRRYNQIAGEFQLFQVLLHRFIENEPFQGPRVQNYAKNRCVFRNLLQVPVVKDDGSKHKAKVDDEDAITSRMLSEIIDESMQVFWEFLLADKEESTNNSILQRHQHHNAIPRDAVDAELLLDVRTKLHKKDKKLKDVLRSGNCIVKRLQKQQEKDKVPHSWLVAQVELRLVARVINMQKLTTDQLIWCLEKLERISISKRNVFVETSFMLFPC